MSDSNTWDSQDFLRFSKMTQAIPKIAEDQAMISKATPEYSSKASFMTRLILLDNSFHE